MTKLSAKVAIVTGCASGIGAATLQRLISDGANVIGTDVNAEAGSQLCKKFGAIFLEQNIADRMVWNEVVSTAVKKFGRLDILVNNAGITRDNLALRMKDEDWDAVLSVNLTSSFRLIRASLRGMVKRRYGRIIGITSVVGATGNPGQANYAASKAGMIGMSKSLAQEVASRNITVNCVAPGFIATPMTGVLPDEQKDALLTGIPAGRLGSGDDIASACLYLASEEAAYVTGQTLHVNGGMAMI